jgi:peptide-methionine (R)-S-oxide reductase
MEKIKKTDAEWRAQLTPEQYRITRQHGTERAFTGPYHDAKDKGTYTCVACGLPLYVAEKSDNTLFMRRTEVLCARCDAHLGHVFPDGPKPTGLRYCMNGHALKLEKK